MNTTNLLLKWVLGICALLVLCFALLVGVITQIAGAASTPSSSSSGCRASDSSATPAATLSLSAVHATATATSGGETTCYPDSQYGSAVVDWAKKMADALYVNPACGNTRGGACNDTWYTSAFPQPVIDYGQTWCQAHGDCADWANGSYQCVSFVRGAYSQVYPMTLTNDAFELWATYQHVPGWQEIPALATADPAQRFLPEPGDVMVFKDLSVGHVAIVMAVQAPGAQKNGWVAFANANSSSAYDRMPLLPNLTVDTSEWAPSGEQYAVWGYIRPKPATSHSIARINQLDQAHSASSNDTLAQFGGKANGGEHGSLAHVSGIATRSLSVMVGWPPDCYAGGHRVVVIRGNLATGTRDIAGHSLWNRHTVSAREFL